MDPHQQLNPPKDYVFSAHRSELPLFFVCVKLRLGKSIDSLGCKINGTIYRFFNLSFK